MGVDERGGGLPVAAARRIPVVDGTIRNARVDPRFALPRRAAMRASCLVVANSLAGLRAWRMEGERGRVVYNGFDPGGWSVSTQPPPVMASADGRAPSPWS